MPTYEALPRFVQDFRRLSAQQRSAFMVAVGHLVHDIKSGILRAGLRVKRVKGAPGVFEMTWAPDGRATFGYGPQRRAGGPHIVWRRVGTHEILSNT